MRRAFARAGFRSGKIHILRHTLATRLHSTGVDIKQVADLLGHQSLDTTAARALRLIGSGSGLEEFLRTVIPEGQGGRRPRGRTIR